VNFTDNRFVSTLSQPDQAALLLRCRSTVLRARDILAGPTSVTEHVYFLTGASVAQMVPSGRTTHVAVGLVGFSGVVGLQFALDTGPSSLTLLVQERGPAWVIDGDVLHSMIVARPTMLLAISRYLWADAQELAHYAGSVQSQTVAQRLARWIVKSQGGRTGVRLMLTHAHIADMLGVRRASVSAAAIDLREQGLLDYTRGQFTVRDQAGLEALALSHR
jgi:CRP-like cAMP-binding protein